MLAKEQAQESVFYGWWIVGGCFVVLFISAGVGLYAPPVFLVPLQQDFGWSRAAIAGGTAVSAVVSGLLSPLIGAWIDRYGSRTVMTFGALLMGSSFMLLSTITAMWQLYVLDVAVGVGLTCCAFIPSQSLISNWFNKKRGVAMGITLTGIGFGGLAMAPLAGMLLARVGWRMAFVGLGGLTLCVVTVVVLSVVRSRPTDLGLRPDGDGPGDGPVHGGTGHAFGPGLDLGTVVRTNTFWVLAIAHFLWTFASFSILGHLVAHLRDAGFEGSIAAGALGIMSGVSVAGRAGIGYFADRTSKRTAMSAGLAISGVATAILLIIDSWGALPLFLVVYGLAIGSLAVLFPLLIGECFGLLAFGKILGLITIAATLGGAAGPVLTGHIYDATGSYHSGFAMHVAAFFAASLAIRFLPPPPHSEPVA